MFHPMTIWAVLEYTPDVNNNLSSCTMLQVAKDLREQKEKEVHQIDPASLRSLRRQCGRLQMHRVTAQEAKKKEEERRKMQKKREERKAKQAKKKVG